MYLTSTEIRDLTDDTLRKFLAKKIPEGHHLDYKIELSGHKAKQKDNANRAKREFLKDITAFANANGGDLLIGVMDA